MLMYCWAEKKFTRNGDEVRQYTDCGEDAADETACGDTESTKGCTDVDSGSDCSGRSGRAPPAARSRSS
jgi:hypothetical protein